ncbi:hypothetical protein C8F01DRAFT_934676, partial [Mycena amicta]
YYDRTRDYAQLAGACTQVFYPKWYDIYQKAFAAGQYELRDPGPFLGRALVWKLQVTLHRDGLDIGPTLIASNGYYEGGSLLGPDVESKFSYQRGEIVLGYFGSLYHSLEKWYPTPLPQDLGEHRVTSGRMSHVFFSPAKSLAVLESKPPNWNVSTSGG